MRSKRRARIGAVSDTLVEHGIDGEESPIGDLATSIVDAIERADEEHASERRSESGSSLTEHQAFMAAIAAVTKRDISANAGQIARAAKLLRESPEEYRPQDILVWYKEGQGWWYRVYRAWMREKDQRAVIQPPSIQQVVDTIKLAKDWAGKSERHDAQRYVSGLFADIIQS